MATEKPAAAKAPEKPAETKPVLTEGGAGAAATPAAPPVQAAAPEPQRGPVEDDERELGERHPPREPLHAIHAVEQLAFQAEREGRREQGAALHALAGALATVKEKAKPCEGLVVGEMLASFLGIFVREL